MTPKQAFTPSQKEEATKAVMRKEAKQLLGKLLRWAVLLGTAHCIWHLFWPREYVVVTNGQKYGVEKRDGWVYSWRYGTEFDTYSEAAADREKRRLEDDSAWHTYRVIRSNVPPLLENK